MRKIQVNQEGKIVYDSEGRLDKVSNKDAETMLERYQECFPELLESLQEFANREGYMLTVTGRKRFYASGNAKDSRRVGSKDLPRSE